MESEERDLLERFRAGEEDALEAVYYACLETVTRVAHGVLRRWTSSGTLATSEVAVAVADVVQEVFVRAFAPAARARVDAERSYGPYLARIARNTAIDHLRQRHRYVPCDIDGLMEQLPSELDLHTAANDWSEAETLVLVKRYLGSIDDETRRVHDAIYVQGMSQRDAAELLGVGRQVVRTAEARLRSGLQRELARATGDRHLATRAVRGKVG